MKKKVAVILCGSGYKDGSEIRESVLTLLALNQQQIKFECFAPNDWQKDVVNCLTGESMPEKRNMLIEAARIARGDIRNLTQLDPHAYDALVLPGGFGAAKNLCTFAFEGGKGQVRNDLSQIIETFYQQKRPIGAICIAPVILAMVLKNKNLQITLGAQGEAAEEVVKLGHQHKVSSSSNCVVDKEHKIVTTPAYMDDQAELSEIFEGISKAIKELMSLT